MEYAFDIEIAKQYGVDEAILIKNLAFWISKNKANNSHVHDGSTWTYNSIKAFSLLFPFWTEKQIRRILGSLVNQNVIKIGNYNKVAYDQTRWYAFIDEDIFLKDFHLPKWENGNPEKGKPIPNINTDSKQLLLHNNEANASNNENKGTSTPIEEEEEETQYEPTEEERREQKKRGANTQPPSSAGPPSQKLLKFKTSKFPEPTWQETNDTIDMFNIGELADYLKNDKAERSAIQYLWRRIGGEKLKIIITYALSLRGMEYAPQVNRPTELKKKIGAVISHKKKEDAEEEREIAETPVCKTYDDTIPTTSLAYA